MGGMELGLGRVELRGSLLEFKANWDGWGSEGLLDSEDAVVVLHRSSDTI